MRGTLTPVLVLVAAGAGAVVAPLHGQNERASSQPAAAFEAASVKPNRSGEQRSGFATPENRFVATNVELHELIAWAYGEPGPPPELRPDFQMSGGPAWITIDRFDVEATTGSDVPDGVERTRLKMRLLQTLLAERFTLSVHHETREGPIYSLVLANRGGRLGPQLRRSAVDCNAMTAPGRANAAAPPPPPPPPQGQVPACGVRVILGGLRIGSQSLAALARLLSRATGRPVIDRTGLDGAFDLSLDFDPSGLPAFDRPPGAPPLPADISEKPSMFTTLQEQAGLKLEAGRGPIDILVIDAAERPAEN